MHFSGAINARSRIEGNVETCVVHLSELHTENASETFGKLPTTSRGKIPFTTGEYLECKLWKFRQPNTHSEPINKPLVNEIMDFPDIINRNNNYVENLHSMSNNENKI